MMSAISKSGSILGGVLYWDEIQSLDAAKEIISTVHKSFNFYHATEFPDKMFLVDGLVKLIDKTMKFIGGDKECLNKFVANLRLYKLTAITHLGKVNLNYRNKISENISVNANAAAFRLVMLVNYLLTLERNNNRQKSAEVITQLKKYLEEYFSKVAIDSMKAPFDGWKKLIKSVEKNSADKIAILEKMSRSILF